MDPDVALTKLRILITYLEEEVDAHSECNDECVYPPEVLEELSAMVNEFQALDSWLSKGGFLPQAWNR